MCTVQGPVMILDPSDKFRPEKPEEEFRKFDSSSQFHDRVSCLYHEMHTKQTYDFALQRRAHWCQFNHAKMSIWDALEALNVLVDQSDPDCDVPNCYHALQTAERIREVHPDKDWFQLTGFIHDLGKVMAIWDEAQYAVVGDTYPLGCAPRDSIVFGTDSFRQNPDRLNPKYNTRLGIYEKYCGLDNVMMTWGHDEYMYQMLKHNNCKLPQEGLYMVRYHSFYSWHTGGDYRDLVDNVDMKMMDWVLEFNKFDLYSKADSIPDPEALKPYYQSLIEKYIPGELEW